jgi:hypothetical protein
MLHPDFGKRRKTALEISLPPPDTRLRSTSDRCGEAAPEVGDPIVELANASAAGVASDRATGAHPAPISRPAAAQAISLRFIGLLSRG